MRHLAYRCACAASATGSMVSSTKWHDMDGSPIVVTENVVEYRKAITELVTAEDVVLEVGCAEGVTTALIADAAKQVVGIDKSPSQAAKAAARHQGIANLSFAQVDGYDLAAVRRLADAAGIRQFSVIFIDVSGSRKVGDVETLLVKYEQVFNPRLFVVKAYQLKRLIMRCQLCTVAGHAGGDEEQQQLMGTDVEVAKAAAAAGCKSGWRRPGRAAARAE